MSRKVSVGLVADVAEFIKGMVGAKKAVDDLGDKVEKLDDEIDKIPPDAAKAAAALKLLGGNVDDVSTKVNNLGEKNTGLAILDNKIKETRAEVKKLADEFVKTGDVDVFKKLGDAQGRLQGLQAVRKKLADAIVPDEKDVEGFFKRIWTRANNLGDNVAEMLPKSISGALSTPILGPIIAAALIAALVAAVSTVLATAGGLISAAGVGGVVGLGIVGAIMGNPEVIKARWSTALEGIKHEFIDAAQPFQQPLIDAAAQVQAAFGSLQLEQTFAKAASYLQPLVAGGLEFARYIGEAVNYLTENAGPVVEVLAEELPKVGKAIAEASKSISEGGEGGAQALKDLLGIIEMVVAGLGGMIGAAEKVYDKLAKFRDAVIPRDWLFPPDIPKRLDNGARALGGVGDAAKSSVVDLDAMDQKLGETAVTLDSLEGKIVGKIFAATMGLDQAFLGVAESQTKLQATFEESRKTLARHADQLDINTKQGQANREAVLAAVTANMSLYQAQLQAGMSAEDAAQAYDDNTAALEDQLRKAHLTQGEIDGLIGKYRGIPKKVDTDIAINGLTSAINGLADLIRQINGIHDKTVTIYYRTKGQSLNAPLAHGGIRRAAVGMVIPPSDPGTTLVGEPQTGGEALIPLRGISQGRAMQLAQTVGDSYGFGVSTARGGGPIAITLAVAGNDRTWLGRGMQEAVDGGHVQIFVNGQRATTRR